MKDYLGYYLIIMSVITFVLFLWDKHQSIRGGWRIKEKTLLLFCLIGGSFGGFLAMRFLRHKNRKPRMRNGIIMMTILWAILLLFIGSRFS